MENLENLTNDELIDKIQQTQTLYEELINEYRKRRIEDLNNFVKQMIEDTN